MVKIDMEMPKSCGKCRFNRVSSCSALPIYSNGKLAGYEKFPFGIFEEHNNKYKNCPLKELNNGR